MVRKVSRVFAAMALVVGVTACDDNPLAEDRDQAAYFRLNPSVVTVDAGGTASVDAIVNNKFGAATNAAVTATPCDNKITAVVDTGRSEFEYPERFIITGVSTGVSCLVVRGGGLTDTVSVNVVPAALDLSLPAAADSLLESGDIVNLGIAYRDAANGNAAGVGFDERTTFSISTASVGSIDEQGQFIARGPGTTWIRASFTDLGVTRRDSVQVRVVPAVFRGTATQTATGGGQVITFTPGSLPFDANTRVEFTNVAGGTFVHLLPNDGNLMAAIPAGTAAGTVIQYNILNAGPNESTVAGTFTTTTAAPAADPFNNNDSDSARPIAVGQHLFGTINGTRGAEEWFVVNITEAGSYRVSFQWNDNQDKDLYVVDAEGNAVLTLENVAATNPEADNVNLSVGTYYIIGSTWTPASGGAPVYYRVGITKN